MLSVPRMLFLAVCKPDARMFDISRLQFPELAECGTACMDDRALTLFSPGSSFQSRLSLYLSPSFVSRPTGYTIATRANPTRIPVSCTTGCHKSPVADRRSRYKCDINSIRINVRREMRLFRTIDFCEGGFLEANCNLIERKIHSSEKYKFSKTHNILLLSGC